MSYNLSTDQHRLVNLYINQYNQTNNHIDYLLNMLEEIRNNILNVLSSNRNTNRNYRNSTRHTDNTNFNNINRFLNQLSNQRENNYIQYDYNNPINPNLYNISNRHSNNNARNDYDARNNYDAARNDAARNDYDARTNNVRTNDDAARNDYDAARNDYDAARTNNVRTNNIRTNNIRTNNNIETNAPRQNNANGNFYQDFLRGFNIGFNSFVNSNVIVRPTEEQIQNASRLVRYGDILEPLSETCPITLERFNSDDMVRQIHSCGHIFCQSAFTEWFNSNVRCPVCRYDIREHTNNNTIPVSNNSNPNPSVADDDSQSENSNNEEDIANSNTDNSNENTANINENNTNLNTLFNSISNLNVIRNPDSNEVEHLTFDLTNSSMTDELINNMASRILQGMLNPTATNNNNNDRILFDASNNVLFYETIIMPNNQI